MCAGRCIGLFVYLCLLVRIQVHGFVWIHDFMRSALPLKGLRLIRGQQLYLGQWAFYVSEASILQEIQAYALKEIANGAAHFTSNPLPALCFIQTLPWRDIFNSVEQYSASSILSVFTSCKYAGVIAVGMLVVLS